MSINGSSSKNAHGSNGESFEDSFRRLQEVVKRLSDGNLSLQESLTSFEEGMRLAERCSSLLDEAELRVRQASERAMQEGMASLASLDPALSQAGGDVELVEVEVEHYEAAILLDAAESGRAPRPPASGPAQPPPGSVMGELDPLFDEDD
jgi:exodeoxyribonuclease VII small subunit